MWIKGIPVAPPPPLFLEGGGGCKDCMLLDGYYFNLIL